MKIVCPNCQKKIDTQAEVQIPNDTTPIDYEGVSVLLPAQDMSGVTNGNIVYKDGKYYLVFESIIICPNCKENFCFDIWLPTVDQP